MIGRVKTRSALEALRRLKLKIDPRVPRYDLPRWPATTDRPLSIAVVGAGISGLLSAKLLRDLGHQVRVFEAQRRVGGRVHTLSLPEVDVPVEAGATRITDEHRHTLYWLDKYGLRLVPMYPAIGRLVRLNGCRRELGPDASSLSSHGVHRLVHDPASWSSSLRNAQSIRSSAIECLTKPTWYTVAGGLGQLPKAIASELGPDVSLGVDVTRMEQRQGKVFVHLDAGSPHIFDKAVVAVPRSVLDSIQFDPMLSMRKRQLLHAKKSQASLRVFAVLRGRDWTGDDACGWGCTDAGIEVWHPTDRAESPYCVLMAYAQGEPANPFVDLEPRRRETEMLSLLQHMFPGMESRLVRVTSHCWNDDPWARGAQTLDRQDEAEAAALREAETSIHFCGEHTSSAGWIDGTIASAYRVVDELASGSASG